MYKNISNLTRNANNKAEKLLPFCRKKVNFRSNTRDSYKSVLSIYHRAALEDARTIGSPLHPCTCVTRHPCVTLHPCTCVTPRVKTHTLRNCAFHYPFADCEVPAHPTRHALKYSTNHAIVLILPARKFENSQH